MSAIKVFNTLSPSTWTFENLFQDTYRERQLRIYTFVHHLTKMFASKAKSDRIYEFSLALYYTVCTLTLTIPIINSITYIAYSAIFQIDLNQQYEAALNEGNLGGAFVLAERGAEVKCKNKEGKVLVDLFLDKFSRSAPSTDDIEMVHQLIEKGAPFDKKHPGFSQLFLKAESLNKRAIIFSLLEKEIFPNVAPLLAANYPCLYKKSNDPSDRKIRYEYLYR